jgi:predicted ATP-grasp superfamily ATP-dependent carboligase
MSTPILLLSTGTLWIGTARIPKALAAAGFKVALLTPHNSLAEKSRFVTRIGHLPDGADAAQWVFALAAMVKAVSPRILLACDDMSYRLLCTLFFTPPPGLQPTLHEQLRALIRESLGDPGYYVSSVDKVRLPPIAAALGVRVAAYQVITTADEALAFAAGHGFPVVLKSSHSTAGTGVWICAGAGEVQQAFVEWQQNASEGEASDGPAKLLVQAGIDGNRKFYSVAAWKGAVLTGYASDAIITHPAPKGPATVVRHHRDPELRDAVERMVRAFGMTGIFSFEFMINVETGLRYLIEINRRITPGLHRGARIRVDLCAALLAAIEGRPSPTRSDLDEGEEGINVHFPQEWLRDPESPYLRSHPVDVPWDEPELIEAMLALRNLE